MTIVILILLVIFAIVVPLRYKHKYSSEPNPEIRKKMLRKGMYIGLTPLVIVILYILVLAAMMFFGSGN